MNLLLPFMLPNFTDFITHPLLSLSMYMSFMLLSYLLLSNLHLCSFSSVLLFHMLYYYILGSRIMLRYYIHYHLVPSISMLASDYCFLAMLNLLAHLVISYPHILILLYLYSLYFIIHPYYNILRIMSLIILHLHLLLHLFML